MALIENVIKRVRAAGFVIYNGAEFLDKNDKIINVASGSPGGGGSTDVAAAILAAANKSTPVNADELALMDSETSNALKALAIGDLKTAIETYIKTKDFVRVDANKDLLNGTGVIVTQAATGNRFGFLSGTTATDPGTGLFKMSVATIAANAAVSFYVSDFDKNGTNISAYFGAWKSGGIIYARSAAAIDTSFAVVALSTVTDNSPENWFTFAGTAIGGNSFAGGEPVVLQYIPPTDVASIIFNAASKATPADADKFGITDSAASNVIKSLTWANLKTSLGTYLNTLGFTKLDSNGNLLDATGTVVDAVNPVYALTSAPVSGITALPAAGTVNDGTVTRLHKDCLLSGAGANPSGVLIMADQENNVWRPPLGIATLYSKRFGTIASPTLHMTNANQGTKKFAVGTDPKIPASLLYTGCWLEIEMHFRRNVTTVGLGNVLLICYMGTDATTQTNNSIVWQANIGDVDKTDMMPNPLIYFNSETSVTSTRNLAFGSSTLASARVDLSTLINTASDMYITWQCSTVLDVNNSIDFLGYTIRMRAI